MLGIAPFSGLSFSSLPDIAEVVNKRELRYALQTGYIRISLSLVLPFCYFEDSQF